MEHLAVVTGASSGIGFELAKYAAEKDYDLIVAANEPQIEMAADKLRANGTEATPCKRTWRRAKAWTSFMKRSAPAGVRSTPY